MEKFVKLFKAEIKGIDEKEFTLEALVSTKKKDRDGDVIVPDSFGKRLSSYKDHPVLLSSHDYWDLRKQIGEAVSVKPTEEGLVAKFKYYVGLGNPEADWAWVLAQKGIAAYSIGFIGHGFEWIEEKDEQGNKFVSGRKFTDIELLEVSQVLVPSNRQALQMSIDLAREQGELCVMAMKSFDSGDLKVPEPKPEPKAEPPAEPPSAPPVLPVEPPVAPAPETEKHYSESLLGEGADKPTLTTDAKEVGLAISEFLKDKLK